MWLSSLVVVLDQVTKYFAELNLSYCAPVKVIPGFFSMTLVYNKGAAFNFLSDAGGWQRWFFVTISFLAAILLTVWLRKLKSEQWALALALSVVQSDVVDPATADQVLFLCAGIVVLTIVVSFIVNGLNRDRG